MIQIVLLLSIVSLTQPLLADRVQNKWFVYQREISFIGQKDWLHYIDIEEKFTYDQAQKICKQHKVYKPILYYLGISKSLPFVGEFWIPFDKIMIASNGKLKFASKEEDWTQRKGIICQAPIEAAMVVYRNGSLSYLHNSKEFVPSYCYPQNELSAHELDSLDLRMCLLLHKPLKLPMNKDTN